MKSSTALLSLAILAVAAFAYGILFLAIPASSQPATDSFEVSFEEYPSLDHVCFVIDVDNTLAADSTVPFKPLLNATSIDVQKAQVKLYAERESTYTVTVCNACAVESCFEDNVTDGTICENFTVTDCSLCGSTETQVPRTSWEEVDVVSTEKVATAETKEIRNTFADVAMTAGKPERYKLCYHFNEIPINPSTGKPGSYGYMYLDLGGKSYFDFEHSSWWNYSLQYKRSLTQVDSSPDAFLAGSKILTFNGTETEVWCDSTAAYLYYNNETGKDAYCVNAAETDTVGTDLTNTTFPDDKIPWGSSALAILHLNGTDVYSSVTGYSGWTLTGYPDTQLGKIGVGLHTDGSGDLSINHANILDTIPAAGTVMYWFKLDDIHNSSATLRHQLFESGDGTLTTGFVWTMLRRAGDTDAGKLQFAICRDNSIGQCVVISSTTNSWIGGEWYHTIATWQNDGNMSLYINGVKEAVNTSYAYNAWTDTNYNTAFGTTIAGSYATAATFDEIRIYNLSIDDIQANSTYWSQNKALTFSAIGEEETMQESITFHIYSGETGENLSSVNIYCNNSWTDTIDSGHVEEFECGDYECTFEKQTPTKYYNKTILFTANDDMTVDVLMSERAFLTIQEHDWIEAIYDCLHTGDCLVMNLLLQINETTSKTWNEFKPTDWSTIDEEITSNVVGPTSNITIDYSIAVPQKEGYGVVEGIQPYDDFLPIRLTYWFLDNESATECHSQGEYDIAPVEPYCKPVVAYTVGQILTDANFTVEIHPDLPEGSYYLVRKVEIDPESVWIGYGQEIIGSIMVFEDSEDLKVSISSEAKPSTEEKECTEPVIETASGEPIKTSSKATENAVENDVPVQKEATEDGKTTGMAVANPFDPSYVSVMVSVMTLVIVLFVYRNSRTKRSPWGY